MSNSEPVIEVNKLSRRFGHLLAVNDLTLSVPKASIFGFLGPNGCGKSTTIRMLCGLLSPTSGQVKVLGHDIPREAEQLRRQVGYMTQRFSLYEDLSAQENLQFIGKIYGVPHRALKCRIDELIELYDFANMRHQRAGSMSGGQRQRLALAAATLHKPALLFLDEPTSAVDPENRREFWEQLFDLCAQGTSILVSTHYMDEAERCHQLAILEAGELRALGSPKQLMDEMNTHVIEILADNLREVKKRVLLMPEVRSAAQQGLRLRVLVNKTVSNPQQWLSDHLNECPITCELVRPSLEDVFVTVTGNNGSN